ncbi:MAG: acyl-CoA dehydrogenase [Pseudomonadales bacterium]|nr:acyl-CoA dehydrogenase [Pseudomonadales bacterium]
MPIYKAPLRDMRFVAFEVFKAEEVWAANPAFVDVDRDLVDAILEESARFNEEVLFPLNRSGDEEGCRVEGDTVRTPTGFRDAFRQYAEGGWIGLGADVKYGGQGLPKMVTAMTDEILFGCNPSFALYPLLGIGAALAMSQHADESLNETYLPKIYSGEWSGTMCLTEPHAGTDLGIIRTRAEPQADNSYLLTGTKIFITGGEHDLADNIIHLVLAKLPGAPAGSKGISLFLVPKFLVNDDGSLGERNAVHVGSIEHKMGIKASATCVMNFDGARGWLVGEPNEGLAAMFVMMNYERLSMGLQGLGASEVAYQNAAAYARDRLQGRSATGAACPDKAADPLLVHPDIRRMLLTVRAHNEAARCFAMYVSQALDASKYGVSEADRKKGSDLVALLTPVAKAFLSDRGFDACVMAQQVFGGHGYIREWGMEQLVRDTRIAQIYEGTNGVQAMDLAGRKVVRNQGAYVRLYVEDVRSLVATMQQNPELNDFSQALVGALIRLEEATDMLLKQAASDAHATNAAAVDYLHLFGLVSYAHMWAMMAQVAVSKRSTDVFYQHKLELGRYFMQRMLPEIDARLAAIKTGPASLMQFPVEYF